jgi:nitrile hydratase subunit beta
MDGVHDLGGMQGFGPVVVEADEPVFHEEWEGRTFAMGMGSAYALGLNLAVLRHASERMEPGHYLTASYYEHWQVAFASALIEDGLLQRAELEARCGPFPTSHPALVDPDDVDVPTPSADPAFAVGDAVRVRDRAFAGHTRCPRYVRGRRGVVVHVHDPAPIAEIEAHRRERVLEHTYGVRFEADELWRNAAEVRAAVYVDLYEHDLEGCEEP